MVESKNNLKAWLYLAPALILMAIFIFYPLFNTILIAFKEKYNYMTGEFTQFGFGNFAFIFRNQIFWRTVSNTFFIVFVSVPISIMLSLLIAVGLNSIKPLQKVFQTIFFLPYVTNTIAIGMVFAVMFNQSYGLINTIIGWLGLDNAINWVGYGAGWGRAMTVLLIYSVWEALPFKILIFLSGLQGIDKQYYQAAQIDSTPRVRVFTRITVPLLSPMIAYVAVTSFIGAFKEYTSVVALFGLDTSIRDKGIGTIVWFLYRSLSDPRVGEGSAGWAAAAALFLFVIILIFTFINLYISKKRVHY
ncbi:MAG TPA: sugar ABC transporter permease [Bacilli bacterium]|nr:sugar ABC transporter permease [Bacilli bacterium]